MYRKPNKYYVAYAYEGEDPSDMGLETVGEKLNVRNEFDDYRTALRYARWEHKAEIEFQKEENGRDEGDWIHDTYVMYTEDGYVGEIVAAITGWKSKVERW